MLNSKNVLVIGLGYLGDNLADLLLQSNYKVFSIKRNIMNVNAKFHPVSCDVCKPIKKSLFPEHFDYIVYCISPDEYTENSYEKTFVTGVTNIVTYLEQFQSSWKKFIFISSTSVYSEENGATVDEESIIDSNKFPGKYLIKGEEITSNLANQSAVIRFSGIYGTNRLARFSNILDNIKKSKPVFAEKNYYMNMINVEDCALSIKYVIDKSLIGKYLVTDNQPILKNTFIKHLAEYKNIKIMNQEVCNYRSSRKIKNKKCSNKKILSTGFKFKYPTAIDFINNNI